MTLSLPRWPGLPPAGVDDVFVFINTYRQATHLEDPQLRMIHTIQTAGKATFFTSLTTAAAYAANVFSQVGDRPLPLPPPPHLPYIPGPVLCSFHGPFSCGHTAFFSGSCHVCRIHFCYLSRLTELNK